MVLYHAINQAVMNRLYIIFVSIVGLVYTLRYSSIAWTGCLTSVSVAEKLQGVAFKQCLQECAVRAHCKAVNYWTRAITCEIVDNASGMTVGREDGACVYVQRENILDIPPAPDDCTTCPEYRVCDGGRSCAIQVCPRLSSVDHALIYGNVWNVDARAKIVCPYGSTSGASTAQVVCQSDGTWANVPVCRHYCEQLPPMKPNSTRVDTRLGLDAEATYTCSTGYVVEQNGVKTSQTTQTATCNSATKTWVGLEFACVSECSLFDSASYVQVSNMKFKVYSTPSDQPTAKADCQEVCGDLLRLDTNTKHAALKAYLNNQTGYTGLHLWVQGEYSGGQWAFNNGDAMPADGILWYDDNASSSCVVLNGDRDFRWDDRGCHRSYGYICEI